MDAWLENLKGKITQLNECLGEYESHEWCDHCIIDAKCAQITMHVTELKENAKKWEMVFGDIQKLGYVGTAEMLKSLKRKAELWDQYAIYDNDKEEEILVKDLIIAYEKLETVKTLIMGSGLVIRTDKLKAILEATGQ